MDRFNVSAEIRFEAGFLAGPTNRHATDNRETSAKPWAQHQDDGLRYRSTHPTKENRNLNLVLAVDVVDDEAQACCRHLNPVAALQRAHGVLVAAEPVLAH